MHVATRTTQLKDAIHLLHGTAVGGDGLLFSDDSQVPAAILVAVDELSLHREGCTAGTVVIMPYVQYKQV